MLSTHVELLQDSYSDIYTYDVIDVHAWVPRWNVFTWVVSINHAAPTCILHFIATSVPVPVLAMCADVLVSEFIYMCALS